MLKLTTDRHEASRGLFATAELLVYCRPHAVEQFAKRHHICPVAASVSS